jgi:iron complex transport system substrate-binding protein
MSEDMAKRRIAGRRGWGIALAGAIVFIAVASCAAEQAANRQPTGSELRQVTDETGRQVAVPRPVQRIVSLAPNITETLFALGLGNRVIGDTDFCDYPAEAKNRPRIGGPVTPNFERIAALHPDLVVTSSINPPAAVHSLEQIGIPVYTTNPATVEQVLASIKGLADLLDAGAAGAKLVDDLHRRLDDLRRRVAVTTPKRVLVVIWDSPLISAGSNTFVADALIRAGAVSVIRSSLDWPTISLEEAVRQQPEYLIFFSDAPGQKQVDIAELRHRRGWSDIEALRRGRVIVLPEAMGRPSPRLMDAIEVLARALHPEQFGSVSTLGGGSH